MEEQLGDPVIYWLDAQDRIVQVNDVWDQFARANGGDGMLAAAVQGQPLWRFVSGDPTRMWLDAIVNVVRITRKPQERPYRCDCPQYKRFMRMRVIPEPSGLLVRVEHHILALEPREPVQFEFGRGQGMAMPRCSVCCRVQQHGQWVDPDPGTPGQYRVFYTVCPQCREGGIHAAVTPPRT
ncbi:hypothetical protein TDMWS_16210 [Thermodesulfomicrobium sp. WS]|uniref:hypothetical protein n=1 Tax=Thermodesulfomicrobium sp. WS TaxID=3004129 RepID=UPI00248FAFC1|nr:hypothetical protein [Thermodesulfomicrobium sp. WS]BDV01536.1 hypothetical protein TDMWS_16210 [Thermodesulfomicrobium sp. WS]